MSSKTKELLKMALANAHGDPALSEVRQYITQAISRLDQIDARKERSSRRTQSQQWWDHIVAHTVASPSSPQAAMRSLKDLNAMISAEQKKIADLEKLAQTDADASSLLKD